MLPKFKSGIIHLGILAIVFILISIVATVAILADKSDSPERYLSKANVYQTFCNRDPVRYQNYCKKAEAYKQKATAARLKENQNPASSISISPTGPCYPIGDANGDNKLDDADAQAIVDNVAGIKLLTGSNKTFADVDSSGFITSADATLIRQYLSGQISKFPRCPTVNSSTPTPLPNISSRGPCPPMGDVTGGENRLDDTDAQAILDHLAGIKLLSGFDRIVRADVNGDGKITSLDASLIRQYLAGQITDFTGCRVASPDPLTDSDGDGFNNAIEMFIGTDQFDACPDNSSDAAWPPDINNDRKVDVPNDILAVSRKNGTNERRYDLSTDGKVDTKDADIVISYYNKSCLN